MSEKLPTLYVLVGWDGEVDERPDAYCHRGVAEDDAEAMDCVIAEYLPATEAVSKERVRELQETFRALAEGQPKNQIGEGYVMAWRTIAELVDELLSEK